MGVLVSGTEIAMSADIVLVRRHLGVIPDAIELSRATLRTIRGNQLWAFGYNLAALPLAARGVAAPAHRRDRDVDVVAVRRLPQPAAAVVPTHRCFT